MNPQLLDLVTKVMLSQTFLEFALRPSKQPTSLFWPFTKARRENPDPKFDGENMIVINFHMPKTHKKQGNKKPNYMPLKRATFKT